MKTSRTWNFRSIAGKCLMGLVLVGSMAVAPVLGKDDHKRMEKHDKGRYEQRGRGHDHDRGRRVHVRRVYRPHGYTERVYVPPPVIYEPPPPPGISIFFPPILIRP